MNSSPLQNCLEAGKRAFKAGLNRSVPSEYARMDITAFAFLKGWDEMAAMKSKASK
tara:strand:- start:737 stop:904 length:168 start_codon:yes stop_codon:yes gene_type:complete